jgi:3-hydroxymyristoyl/3-hydroxydecanoyl-(acyl carrier protein) dehydratase
LPEFLLWRNFTEMTFEVCRAIAADHPSLPGHFPDTPLVPGVLILDEVFAALGDWRKDFRLAAIPTVKFLRPLRPDQPFTIRFSANNDAAREVHFCCRVKDSVIVEGQLEVYLQTKGNS